MSPLGFFRENVWGRYGLAIIAAAAAMGLRELLGGLLGSEAPFVTLFPAVTFVAMVAGFWPAMITAGVGGFYIEYFVILPVGIVFDLSLATRAAVLVLGAALIGIYGERLRKSQMAALNEARQRRLATEAAELGMVDRDLVGGHIYWDERFATILGIAPGVKKEYGRIFEMIHPDDQERVKKTIDEAMEADSTRGYYVEYRVMRADGGMRWAASKGQVYFSEAGPKGRPVRLIGTVRDVTERRREQEKLIRLKELLEAKNKELETIISIVSHDLRAPLVNVKGFSSEIRKDCKAIENAIAQAEAIPEEIRKAAAILGRSIPESVAFIESSAKAMDDLVRSLVQVARAGLANPKIEAIDMAELAAGISANLEFKFTAAGAELIIGELPACRADRTHTTQIFTNLIDNAVKYLDPKRPGKVRFSGRVDGERAVYCIEDNGVGITPENMQKIFEIFFRVAEAPAGGEGIGLTMVKRMAERNGGEIRVESEVGRGSRFYVWLPNR